MKKIVALSSVALLVLSLVGCGGQHEPTATADPVALAQMREARDAALASAKTPALTMEDVQKAVNFAVASAVAATQKEDAEALAKAAKQGNTKLLPPDVQAMLDKRPAPRRVHHVRHECTNHYVTVSVAVQDAPKPQKRNALGMLIGGAVGALAGNQVGGGDGKTLATLAGAAGGAFAGDAMANGNQEQAAPGSHFEQRQVLVDCHGKQIEGGVR